LRFAIPECASFTLLAGAHRPVRSPSVNRFACNRATANPRRLQAQDSGFVLFKFARPALFEARKLKHANCHPLTVVNLSSELWLAATAAGQSERRSSITPGTSLNSGGAQVAQLVEHVTENHGVGGSIPPLGTNQWNISLIFQLVIKTAKSKSHIQSHTLTLPSGTTIAQAPPK
jgi:hypothetical protein